MARKKVAKKKIRKKVAGGAPPTPASPAAAPAPGRPARPPRVSRPGEGFSIVSAIMLVVTTAMIGLVVFIFLPRDISDVVSGYPYDASKNSGAPRNLLREAEEQLVKDEGTLSFSEEEVNLYLNQRLDVTQRGLFGSFVKMDGIYLDFGKDNLVTIYVQRKVFGLPFTVDSTWKYYLSDQKYIRNCTQSRIGQLTVKGAMLKPIMAPFTRFAEACGRERKLIDDESIEQVRIEEGKLTIIF